MTLAFALPVALVLAVLPWPCPSRGTCACRAPVALFVCRLRWPRLWCGRGGRAGCRARARAEARAGFGGQARRGRPQLEAVGAVFGPEEQRASPRTVNSSGGNLPRPGRCLWPAPCPLRCRRSAMAHSRGCRRRRRSRAHLALQLGAPREQPGPSPAGLRTARNCTQHLGTIRLVRCLRPAVASRPLQLTPMVFRLDRRRASTPAAAAKPSPWLLRMGY